MALNKSTINGLDNSSSTTLQKIISEIPKARRSPIRAKRGMSFIEVPFPQKKFSRPSSGSQILHGFSGKNPAGSECSPFYYQRALAGFPDKKPGDFFRPTGEEDEKSLGINT
ncbi:MAG: hypothetical protein V2B13_20315 [Pseudomonadota bacterium]